MASYANQTSDYEWFVENYDKLCSEYGDSFVVVKNKKIIGRYESFVDGVKNTLSTEQAGSFIVQQCHADGKVRINYIASMNFV